MSRSNLICGEHKHMAILLVAIKFRDWWMLIFWNRQVVLSIVLTFIVTDSIKTVTVATWSKAYFFTFPLFLLQILYSKNSYWYIYQESIQISQNFWWKFKYAKEKAKDDMLIRFCKVIINSVLYGR